MLGVLATGLDGPAAAQQTGAPTEQGFSVLKKRLAAEGFPPQSLQHIYGVNPPAPQYKMIATMFRLQESRLNYAQFLEDPAMRKALQFSHDHHTALTQAQAAYGVDRSVIVALLLVETRFGEYTGRTPTLAILSSYALMEQKAYRDRVWALLAAEDRARWGRAAFDEKLLKRAAWAYGELCALLRWTQARPDQAKALHGSIMGAIGWPQFLPSSLERYAVDGNRDGRIDLFQPTDAIWSIAHYLRAHGWKDQAGVEEHEHVIYQYNRSRPYVETVLGVAERLQAAEGRSAWGPGPATS
jgi:membrane-bound lytic murein transglycosylase B